MSLPSPVLLTTEHLVLTMPPAHDATRLVSYFERNRNHLAPWEPERPTDFYEVSYWEKQLESNRRELAEDRSLRLVVFPRGEEGRPVIGVVNFNAFIRGAFQACYLGYSLDRARQGRGLMSEALRAAIEHAFESLHMHRIMANYKPDNERSARLLERLGFVREGYAREYLHIDGAWCDHVLTALVNPSWTGPPRE